MNEHGDRRHLNQRQRANPTFYLGLQGAVIASDLGHPFATHRELTIQFDRVARNKWARRIHQQIEWVPITPNERKPAR